MTELPSQTYKILQPLRFGPSSYPPDYGGNITAIRLNKRNASVASSKPPLCWKVLLNGADSETQRQWYVSMCNRHQYITTSGYYLLVSTPLIVNPSYIIRRIFIRRSVLKFPRGDFDGALESFNSTMICHFRLADVAVRGLKIRLRCLGSQREHCLPIRGVSIAEICVA